MRLLLDNNPSPKLVEPLVAAGHDVAHVTAASQRYQHAAEDRMRELNERIEAGYNARSAE